MDRPISRPATSVRLSRRFRAGAAADGGTSLPLHLAPPGEQPDPVARFLARRRLSRERPLNVLVIEDDLLIGLDIEEMVQSLGCTCCGLAATAAEATNMARIHKPDVILADIRLGGGKDGIAAVQAIRGFMSVRHAFITASTDRPTYERALRTEPLGILIKPVDESQVAALLWRALD